MKAYLKYIGVIDKNDCVHKVELYEGINIITGKSSTGKSALIEIFDYCMGSSEFNIPDGIITKTASIYFIVWKMENSYLILGRKKELNKIFIYEVETFEIKNINNKYFKEEYFIQSKDFNIVLGRYFGLNIDNINENIEISKQTQKKKPRPSIRNIMSYILQHQNLIANKHALFYRFDEKEKREQTIEQFKIFMGFVSEEYFILQQKLHEEKRQLKKFEKQLEEIKNQKETVKKDLKFLLENFELVSGNKLFADSIDIIIANPAKYLEEIRESEIIIDDSKDDIIIKLNDLKRQYNQKLANKRKLAFRLNNIEATIKSINEYEKIFDEGNIKKIKKDNLNIFQEDLTKIEEAIEWLNKELKQTSYLTDSLENDKYEVESKIQEIDKELKNIKNQIIELEEVNKNLENNKDLQEQSLKIKLKIENLLEDTVSKNSNDIGLQIQKINKNISNFEELLKTKYNVDYKIKEAEKCINDYMNKIGNNFDFEDSYKPLNLKFSLETFELWYEKDKKRIYLRSMGSGANWLYSHLSLFLSLNRYFAYNKDSIIPPILFLDQPTQVYFPTSIKDDNEKFKVEEILKQSNNNKNNIDDDLKAVINMFNQFVWHCKSTEKETGVKPQIIITDHVDNISLKDVDFNDLVKNRRWRKHGFIDESNCI